MTKSNTPRATKKDREKWERYRAFCTDFGQFMLTFVQVEDALQRAIEWHTRVNDDVRRAVFSGVRVQEAISFLRRLADVGQIDPGEWVELKRLLDHLSLINEVRNGLVHHGPDGIWEEGEGFVTNEMRALRLDRVREFPISREIVSNMASDLGTIFLLISHWHCGPKHRPRKKAVKAYLAEYRSEPWRYKPQPPKQRHRLQSDKSAVRQPPQ